MYVRQPSAQATQTTLSITKAQLQAHLLQAHLKSDTGIISNLSHTKHIRNTFGT